MPLKSGVTGITGPREQEKEHTGLYANGMRAELELIPVKGFWFKILLAFLEDFKILVFTPVKPVTQMRP